MKLKLLIAEATCFECEMLIKKINLQTIGLEIAGCAQSNGELLAMTEALQPDIILVGVSSTFDSFESIQQIRQQKIKCKFIVICGQQRFDFVYKALKFDVEDFILKPVNEDELNASLGRTANKIRSNFDNIISRDHSEAIRQLFVDNMNTAEFHKNRRPLEEINKIYGTLFQNGQFCVIFVRIDYLYDSKIIFDLFPELQLKIKDLIDDHLRKHCNDILFSRRFNEVMALLNFPTANNPEVKSAFSKLLEATKEATKEFGDLGVSICVGGTYDNISMIKKTREDAHNAAWTRMSRGAGKVLFWEDQGEFPEILKKKINALNERLKKTCEMLDVREFRICADELFQMTDAELNRRELKECAMGMLEYFFEVNSELIESIGDIAKIHDEIKQAVVLSCTFNEFRTNFILQFSKLFIQLSDMVDKKNTKPVRLAIQYVENHYAKPVNLELVAKEVNLSPVYFSHIFKKETGQNFTEYVNEYRILMAKSILKNNDVNVNEVAYALGYGDQRYFSKLFKRIVGVNPTAYKKIFK